MREIVATRVGTHEDAELRTIVVRAFVRDDPDWRAAVEAAVRGVCTGVERGDPAAMAMAVDTAMMRAIHAAVRADAIRDLGVQSFDSKDPLERERWEREGAPAAAARAEAFNRETAAIDAAREV
jgi:hypothetical protein